MERDSKRLKRDLSTAGIVKDVVSAFVGEKIEYPGLLWIEVHYADVELQERRLQKVRHSWHCAIRCCKERLGPESELRWTVYEFNFDAEEWFYGERSEGKQVDDLLNEFCTHKASFSTSDATIGFLHWNLSEDWLIEFISFALRDVNVTSVAELVCCRTFECGNVVPPERPTEKKIAEGWAKAEVRLRSALTLLAGYRSSVEQDIDLDRGR